MEKDGLPRGFKMNLKMEGEPYTFLSGVKSSLSMKREQKQTDYIKGMWFKCSRPAIDVMIATQEERLIKL